MVVALVEKVARFGPVRAIAFPGARAPSSRPALRNWQNRSDLDITQPALWIEDGLQRCFIDTLYIGGNTEDIRQRVLLFSSPNAATLRGIFPCLRQMSILCKASVFAYEYPGYGSSEGVPSERTCKLAAEAAFDFLRRQRIQCIVLVGMSIGSGPTLHLAAMHSGDDIKGVVIWSGFCSGGHAWCGACWSWLGRRWDLFNNLAIAPQITHPIFIMHSRYDRVVPFENALALYYACERVAITPLFVGGGGHGKSMGERACFTGICEFLDLVDPALGGPHRLAHEPSRPYLQAASILKQPGNPRPLSPARYMRGRVYAPHPNSVSKLRILGFLSAALFVICDQLRLAHSKPYVAAHYSIGCVILAVCGIMLVACGGCVAFIYVAIPNCPLPPVFISAVLGVMIYGTLFYTLSYKDQAATIKGNIMLAAACVSLALFGCGGLCEATQWACMTWRCRRASSSIAMNHEPTQPLLSGATPITS